MDQSLLRRQRSPKTMSHRQLASRERICNSLVIDMAVAWRIFFLTMQVREALGLDCTVYFAEHERKALTPFVRKTKTPPSRAPSLNEAVALLGKLGGHLGRAGDGFPGSEVRSLDIDTDDAESMVTIKHAWNAH